MSYKFNGEISEITVTQTAFAKWLGCSQQRVSQMTSNGELVRDEFDKTGRIKLADSLKFYFLSKNSGGDEASYWKEKALHERAKRELAELKLQERRGELYEAAVVESVMIEHLTNFRTKLLGLPAKIAAKLPADIRGEVYDDLTREIENCLDELAKNYHDADLKSFEVDDADIDEGACR